MDEIVNYLLADLIVESDTRLDLISMLSSVSGTGKIAWVNSYVDVEDHRVSYPQFYTTLSIYFKAFDVLVPANYFFTLIDTSGKTISFKSMRESEGD